VVEVPIFTNLLILSGKRKNCQSSGRNLLLYLFILGNSNYRGFTLVSSGGWTMGPLAAQFHRDIVSPHHNKKRTCIQESWPEKRDKMATNVTYSMMIQVTGP
jgi:hypothetical protein